MALVAITHFTDPACSFAFSAEPIRRRLRWHYGVQLVWRNVMIVLTAGDRREAERLAGGAPTLQRLYGMPIDPAPRWASEPLASAEIAMIIQADIAAVRAELAHTASCHPAGADASWSLAEHPRGGPGAGAAPARSRGRCDARAVVAAQP
jgi:hypothetical protein